jgi:hypothetical protein
MDMEENGEEDLNQPTVEDSWIISISGQNGWKEKRKSEEQIGRSRGVGRQKEKRRIGTRRARPQPPRS